MSRVLQVGGPSRLASIGFELGLEVVVVEELARVAAMHRAAPFEAVVTFGAVAEAAAVREALGIFGNSRLCAELEINKEKMRAKFDSLGLSPVRWRHVADRSADVEAIVAHVGTPFIVKPHDGGGSTSVFLLDGPLALRKHLDRWPFDQTSLMIEEYLDGPEISVEALTLGRKNHHVLAITEKTTTGSSGFIETGHLMPAAITGALAAEIHATTIQTLDAIDLELGASHTELRLTRDGPRVIETHARPGGDHLPRLVFETLGIEVARETFRFLATKSASFTTPPARSCASSQFFLFPEGELAALDGVAEARAIPGVLELELSVKPGDRLGPIGNSHDRHGYFLVSGPTREAVLETVRRVRATVVARVIS